jgi:hypothetical protein
VAKRLGAIEIAVLPCEPGGFPQDGSSRGEGRRLTDGNSAVEPRPAFRLLPGQGPVVLHGRGQSEEGGQRVVRCCPGDGRPQIVPVDVEEAQRGAGVLLPLEEETERLGAAGEVGGVSLTDGFGFAACLQ